MSRTKIPLLAFILLFLLNSCDLFYAAPATSTPDSAAIDRAIRETQQAQTLIAFSVQQTVAASGGGAPPAPPASLPTNTTDSFVTVTVSTDTRCRSGPGDAYPILGALTVGQTAQVVGRSASSDNWIVRLPGQTSTCWLWGYYATVVGDTSLLSIFDPPPTPTGYSPTATTQQFINITLVNNSSISIFAVYIRDTGDPSWGTNELGASFILPVTSFIWYNYPAGTYDVLAEDWKHALLKIWSAVSMFSNTTLTYP